MEKNLVDRIGVKDGQIWMEECGIVKKMKLKD